MHNGVFGEEEYMLVQTYSNIESFPSREALTVDTRFSVFYRGYMVVIVR